MPNWCSNTLQISGDKEQLEMFKQKSIIKSGMDVDIFVMDGCVPMPEELNTMEGISDEVKAERIQKYGYCGWYDWRYHNWGTRTDAHDSEIIEEDENGMSIVFTTAWCSPIDYVEKVALMYPDLIFDLYYMETGEWFAGRLTAKGEHINHEIGEPKMVDEWGNEVKYDNEKDMYKRIDAEEWTEDAYEINPFE
jgi:hypothetical protein